jgi:ATP-binding protein involved in chromosome partitioning
MKGEGSSLPKAMPKTTNAMDSHSKPVAKSDDSTVNAEPPITKQAPTQASLSAHPRIRHIIVVASGKGGVGKSTTTVNIALALQKLGNRVGVLDADIYGPSMPAMLGVNSVRPELENEQFVPINAHGLAMLSIGSLLDGDNTPIAWRGPKATGALMQLYNQTNWPQLDYLVIDMPPGTGDIQLTLAQRIPVTGAVIVTTPQHIALLDAQKGIEMFNKTNIPVLGVVENMALHTCSNCNHTEAIFGTGGGEKIAEQYQVPLLGQLPLASAIRAQVDKGEPSVLVDDEFASYYLSIAKNIETNINKFAKPVNDKRIF